MNAAIKDIIEAQVLEYCNRVCPDMRTKHEIYPGAYVRRGLREFSILHYWGGESSGNSTGICSISTEGNAVNVIIAFHRLLRLDLPS